jgi:hypothetical protein
VITGGLSDITAFTWAADPAGNNCGNLGAYTNQAVDDVLIEATGPAIDGVGKILGQAGPCLIRTAGGLPVGLPLFGVMKFDSADLASLESNGTLQAVILHEMGHVLGIGTLWNSGGRNLLSGGGTANPRFTGNTAYAQYQAGGGSGARPPKIEVENTGGTGTRDSHWRASVYDPELMVGFLNPNSSPLSRMTIGSLVDLGYTGPDYTKADPFNFAGRLVDPNPAKPVIPLNEKLIQPQFMIDPQGNLYTLSGQLVQAAP